MWEHFSVKFAITMSLREISAFTIATVIPNNNLAAFRKSSGHDARPLCILPAFCFVAGKQSEHKCPLIISAAALHAFLRQDALCTTKLPVLPR
jgi:hypothetical protein